MDLLLLPLICHLRGKGLGKGRAEQVRSSQVDWDQNQQWGQGSAELRKVETDRSRSQGKDRGVSHKKFKYPNFFYVDFFQAVSEHIFVPFEIPTVELQVDSSPYNE